MATNIVITVPNSLFKFHTPLKNFFDGMIYKLEINSHKQTPTSADIPGIIALMRKEIEEFEQQFDEDKADPNVLVELQDVANFAFLAYVALKLQGHGNGDKVQDNDRDG